MALRHRFPGFALDAAFAAPAGVTALFGRSGSGKTTIVNAIAGLLAPDEGRIVADGLVLLDTQAGVAVPRHRRRVGYVFQEDRLFPHLTVRQNLGFGRWFAPERAGAAEVAHVVEMLGIGHLLARRPAGLSGGEKQRVAIGRALLASPRLLLDGRAAGRARRRPQGRDPALPRAAARRGPGADPLRQPRAARGGAARDHRGGARRRPGAPQRPRALGALRPGDLPRRRARRGGGHRLRPRPRPSPGGRSDRDSRSTAAGCSFRGWTRPPARGSACGSGRAT